MLVPIGLRNTESTPDYILEDNFVDTNGQNLDSGHTPDIDTVGSGWVDWSEPGNLEIQGNQVVWETGTKAGSYIDVGIANYTIEAYMRSVNSAADCMVMIRHNKPTTNRAYAITLDSNPADPHFRVQYYAGSTWSAGNASTNNFVHNVWYTVRAVVLGTNIDVYIDDVLEISGAYLPFNTGATRVGLASWGSAGSLQCEWLRVWA